MKDKEMVEISPLFCYFLQRCTLRGLFLFLRPFLYHTKNLLHSQIKINAFFFTDVASYKLGVVTFNKIPCYSWLASPFSTEEEKKRIFVGLPGPLGFVACFSGRHKLKSVPSYSWLLIPITSSRHHTDLIALQRIPALMSDSSKDTTKWYKRLTESIKLFSPWWWICIVQKNFNVASCIISYVNEIATKNKIKMHYSGWKDSSNERNHFKMSFKSLIWICMKLLLRNSSSSCIISNCMSACQLAAAIKIKTWQINI